MEEEYHDSTMLSFCINYYSTCNGLLLKLYVGYFFRNFVATGCRVSFLHYNSTEKIERSFFLKYKRHVKMLQNKVQMLVFTSENHKEEVVIIRRLEGQLILKLLYQRVGPILMFLLLMHQPWWLLLRLHQLHDLHSWMTWSICWVTRNMRRRKMR